MTISKISKSQHRPKVVLRRSNWLYRNRLLLRLDW